MIYDNFLSIAARAPAASGLAHEGRFDTYAQLAERVGRLASGFAARGIGPGDPVAILMKNSPGLFVVVHALFALGAIAMPLSITATRSEATAAARKAGVTAVVSALEVSALASHIADALGGAPPPPVFVAGESGDWSLGELERTPLARLPTLPADTPALYLLSSGSTGLPKVVPHTHGELLADARRTSAAWRLTPEDRVFDMLPGNFAMGLLLGATNAVEAGATTVYWSDSRPLVLARGALLEALRAERITVMGAVPTMYETLAGASGDARLPHMRIAFSGGAPLQRATFEQVRERFGISLRQAYGSTEALMVSHNDAEEIDRLWDSVGKPSGDARVRLAPIDAQLGAGIGELMVASSSTTAGYLGEDALNAAAFPDGWLMTGDLARVDEAGNIFIKGRSKLLIDVSGFKVDPLEVEEVLQQHPALTDAAVVGVREGRNREQRLKAFVVRHDQVSPDDLVRFLRERLSVHKVPTLIEFRDELPRSSAGKLLRSRLSESGS
jgi:acyl-CoA synthetase (AMP-forming)/AMP-acid ligase II